MYPKQLNSVLKQVVPSIILVAKETEVNDNL